MNCLDRLTTRNHIWSIRRSAHWWTTQFGGAVPKLTALPDAIELPVKPGEAILEAMVRMGFTFRFGCRRGGCGICKRELVSGEVSYDHTVSDAVLSAQEKDAGIALTCRAVPETDVVVAFRDNELRLTTPFLYKLAMSGLESESEE